MEFCPKCGSIMVPKKSGRTTVYVCPSCGYVKQSGNRIVLRKRVEHKETEKTFIIDSTESYKSLPKTTGVRCPVCENTEAYYYVIQTRRADEPPTRIYRCTKCGHVWREYE